MKMSKLFTKTLKNAPADEVSKNAQLLIKAGYVYKVMAGVYAYTPLGIKVLENIKQILREEMNAIDSQELIMTSLQKKETWEQTNRWDDEVVDVWFKSNLKDGTEIGLAWSHEEPILEMLRQYVNSYKDFPISVYQFQTKLRNELRAKSGIMRGREFVMKDLYSLHATEEDLDEYYNKVIEAYKKVFARLGIAEDTHLAFASGGAFTDKFSHEFQTVCEAGEDIMYISEDGKVAMNEEVLEQASNEAGVDKSVLKPVKTAETGNFFKFGTEKSEKMKIFFTDVDGKQKPAYLASYGFGVTRVMGVLVEKFADEKGIVWPESVAPSLVHLISIGADDEAENLYKTLLEKGVTVLYDDREVRPGEKFADADLIGVTHRVVVSEKSLQAGGFEYKKRTEQQPKIVTPEELLGIL